MPSHIPDRKRLGPRVYTDPYGDSRTKQSFVKECDVNNIMSHWASTGTVSHINNAAPSYGDFSPDVNYQESLDALHSANTAFLNLPSATRARFGNNPALFIDFIGDPDNQDEAVKLGLAKPPAEKAPPKTPDPAVASKPVASPAPAPKVPIAGGE